MLVTITLTLMVLAGTFVAMTDAMHASEAAKATTGLNGNLRIGMDMMVRDLIQVGQGLPTGRVVSIPNGDGAAPIVRPGPPNTDFTFDPASPVISAVTPGPGLGPIVDGQQTDMITTLAVDTSFESVCLTALGPNSMLVGAGVNISDGGPDDIQVGDLIMLTKGTLSTLLYVTGTDGAQMVIFAEGDPLNLNQYDDGLDMLGTLDQIRAAGPPDTPTACPPTPNATGIPTRASRVRLTSYYVDNITDPNSPRLIRRLNSDPGRTVAFAVENLQISFDLADGVNNPTNVRMDDDDLGTGGACAPSECSANQIRKVNVFLAGRSLNRLTLTDQFLRNSLSTQVSLRSLAFVDRYR
jgi:hypothetical protein